MFGNIFGNFIYRQGARRLFRGILWGCFFIFVLILIGISFHKKFLPKINFSQLKNNELIAPSFYALDEKNRPYKLSAERGYQVRQNFFEFFMPKACLEEKKGKYYFLEAKKGTFDKDKNILYLVQDVLLKGENNCLIKTEETYVDVKTKDIWGDKAVTGNGDFGFFSGEGFFFFTQKMHLIVKGKSHVTIKNVNSLKKAF